MLADLLKLTIASALLISTACTEISIGFRTAHYQNFAGAAWAECHFNEFIPSRLCEDVPTCVALYMAKAQSDRLPYPASQDFAKALPELVWYRYRWDNPAHEKRPAGEITDTTKHLEFRVHPDGRIFQWSPQRDDWIDTRRAVQNISVPETVWTLIRNAERQGSYDDVNLYRTFLKARQQCYVGKVLQNDGHPTQR